MCTARTEVNGAEADHKMDPACLRDFRIATFAYDRGNPYLDLFYKAVVNHGAVPSWDMKVDDRWLIENAGCTHAIHFHWPEFAWRMRGESTARRARGVFGLKKYLRIAAAHRVWRVWTLHNLEDHEGASLIDRLGYRVLAKNVDAIVCHSRWAQNVVSARYGVSAKTIFVPIGNYDGWYPQPRARAAVLAELGLDPAKPTVVCLGQIRSYKGVETAIDAVKGVGRIQLIVGGPAHPAYDLECLRRRAAGLGNCKLLCRRLSDSEFADLHGACDAVLLPYRKITTSSALVAAWTFGKTVVASDLPFFREMLAHDTDAGALAAPNDPPALAAAISRHLAIPWERRRLAAERMRQNHRWERCIVPFVSAAAKWFRQAAGKRTSGR